MKKSAKKLSINIKNKDKYFKFIGYLKVIFYEADIPKNLPEIKMLRKKGRGIGFFGLLFNDCLFCVADFFIF